MHSSIALHVRARINDGAAPAAGGSDEYAAQDAVLAERIWNNLLDMGYKPVSLDAPSVASAASAVDAAREAAERAAQRTKEISSGPPLQELPPTAVAPVPVPRLVATLIMRHRDRAAIRPRNLATPIPRRSPLSSTTVPMDVDC